jgi:hypothetical protein
MFGEPAGRRASPGTAQPPSLNLAEELAVDLAEALEAIAAVEQRDAEFAGRWCHDQRRRRPRTARHRRVMRSARAPVRGHRL